jgi:hypothetical protein
MGLKSNIFDMSLSFLSFPYSVTSKESTKTKPHLTEMGSLKEQACVVCQSPSAKVCSACHGVAYCSSQHQKQDWKSHKNNCVTYKVEKNETLGRFVVAARNIPQGTVILTEEPLVVGPKMYSPPICLGCHRKVDGSYFCAKCGFPLCSKECEEVCTLNKRVFSENKCKYFLITDCNTQGQWVSDFSEQGLRTEENSRLWISESTLPKHSPAPMPTPAG